MKRVTSRQRLFSWDQFDAAAPESDDEGDASPMEPIVMEVPMKHSDQEDPLNTNSSTMTPPTHSHSTPPRINTSNADTSIQTNVMQMNENGTCQYAGFTHASSSTSLTPNPTPNHNNPTNPTLVHEDKDTLDDYATCLSTASSMTTMATTYTTLPNHNNPTLVQEDKDTLDDYATCLSTTSSMTTMATTYTTLPNNSSLVNGNNSHSMVSPISRINLSNLSRNVSCNSICELNVVSSSSANAQLGCSFSFSMEHEEEDDNHDHDCMEVEDIPMNDMNDGDENGQLAPTCTKRFLPLAFEPVPSTSTLASTSTSALTPLTSTTLEAPLPVPVPAPSLPMPASSSAVSSPIHSKKRDATGTMKKTVSFSNLLVSYPSNNASSPPPPPPLPLCTNTNHITSTTNEMKMTPTETSLTPSTSTTSSLPLTHLNQDVQLHILSYLNIDSIRSVSLSCRTMYQLLYTSGSDSSSNQTGNHSNGTGASVSVNPDAHVAVWWNLIRHTWSPFLSHLLTPYSSTNESNQDEDQDNQDKDDDSGNKRGADLPPKPYSYHHSQVHFHVPVLASHSSDYDHKISETTTTTTTTTTTGITASLSSYSSRFGSNLPLIGSPTIATATASSMFPNSGQSGKNGHSYDHIIPSSSSNDNNNAVHSNHRDQLVGCRIPLGGILAQACSNDQLPTMIDAQFHRNTSSIVPTDTEVEDEFAHNEDGGHEEQEEQDEITDEEVVEELVRAQEDDEAMDPPTPVQNIHVPRAPLPAPDPARAPTIATPGALLRQEIFRRLIDRPLFAAAIAAHAPIVPNFDVMMQYGHIIPEVMNEEEEQEEEGEGEQVQEIRTPQRRVVVQLGEQDEPEFTCYPMKVSCSMWEKKDEEMEEDLTESHDDQDLKESKDGMSSSATEVVTVIQFQGQVGLGNRSVFSDNPLPRPLESITTTSSLSSSLLDQSSMSSTSSISSSNSTTSLSSHSTSSTDGAKSYYPQTLARSALESIMSRTIRRKRLPFVAPYIKRKIKSQEEDRFDSNSPQSWSVPKPQSLIEIDLTPRLIAYFEVSILSRDESQEPTHTSTSQLSDPLRLHRAGALPIHQDRDARFRMPPPPACVAVGISMNSWDGKGKMPGWDLYSYGYHGDDGGLFHRNGDMIRIYGPKYGEGDTVGCGVNYENGGIFYTLNGEFLGYAFLGQSAIMNGNTDLYPTVGIDTSCPLLCNFGNSRPFMFDLAEFVVSQGS